MPTHRPPSLPSNEHQPHKIIIVGGVAGGMSAAARLRRLDESAEITVYEKGKHVSFANCGLPYYIGRTIKDRERLLVQTPESIHNRFNIQVKILHEVTSINRENQSVTVRNLDTKEETTERYDKLILSPGAIPVKPPIPGIDHANIFTIRSLTDTDKINNFITENKPQKAVVVGGGYIGIEMAENLHNRGIQVEIVEMAKQILTMLDYELAAKVSKHIQEKGVGIQVENQVESFENSKNGISVNLASGDSLDADFVILSIGVSPNSTLAESAGLELGVHKSIQVNKHLQTSDPNIYAIGDVIEVDNLAIGGKANIPLAGPANKQGRMAADNIVNNNKSEYKGTIGSGILQAFELEVATTGANSVTLEHEKLDYHSATIHSYDHATYYPNSRPMTLKVLFNAKNGQIYGAQGVGYEGIDKRIDLLTLAIQQKMTVSDLKDIEHAYAPAFSSAKDPVNMLGYVGDNILSGVTKTISWRELEKLDRNHKFILDVRTPEEFKLHSIPNATNIPVDELRNRMNEIPSDKMVVVYCRVGVRGHIGTRILMQNGFDAYNLEGGLTTYLDATESEIDSNHEAGIKKEFDESWDTGMQSQHNNTSAIEIDACGLACPGPIMKLKTEIDQIEAGQTLLVRATDPGFKNDVKAWTSATGNELISVEESEGVIEAKIFKNHDRQTSSRVVENGNDKTIIVFDNDLDKVIASFIIANGALAMGRKVTMFFTFWGLSVLRKEGNIPGLHKNAIEKIFGFMLPKSTKDLKLSQMNMGGMGAKMIRELMESKNIESLEALIEHAIESGIQIIACQMSMDLMGIKREELMDGIEVGGVAQYLEASEKSSGNLFI